jgi:3-oxoacyl-[acyl-carrier protein] reductase
MESLQHKTALITGAGKGLGRAMALALAAEGVNLGLLSRTQEDLDKLAKDVIAINSTIKVATAKADVSDLPAVTKAFTKITEALGQIDILINNAGIARFGSFLELSVDEWESIIRTNLLGAYYCIRQVLPEMNNRKSGDIVNISSSAGLRGAAMTSAYSASKFGLIGLSQSLMQEARKSNIRVFTLTPSTIGTAMALQLGISDGNPEKVVQAEDFAEMVVAHLKLPRRALVRDVSLWSTNP